MPEVPFGLPIMSPCFTTCCVLGEDTFSKFARGLACFGGGVAQHGPPVLCRGFFLGFFFSFFLLFLCAVWNKTKLQAWAPHLWVPFRPWRRVCQLRRYKKPSRSRYCWHYYLPTRRQAAAFYLMMALFEHSSCHSGIGWDAMGCEPQDRSRNLEDGKFHLSRTRASRRRLTRPHRQAFEGTPGRE